jgi:LacI family transcriptional regulator
VTGALGRDHRNVDSLLGLDEREVQLEALPDWILADAQIFQDAYMPRKRADPAITVKEVAAACGYAVPTVIDILGGRGHRYSATANAVVSKAAQRLGWRPNRAARTMRTGQTDCVALVASTIAENSVLPQVLLEALDAGLSQHGKHLAIARLDDERFSDSNTLPKLLADWVCDGLLINYQKRVPPALDRLVDQLALPAIWLHNRRNLDAVYPDEIAIGRMAAEGVLRAGHRRVAYFDPALAHFNSVRTHYSIRDRLAGIQSACADAGITCRLPIAPEDPALPEEDHLRRCRSLLQADDRPTAIIVGDGGPLAELMAAALLAGLDPGIDPCLVTIGLGHRWCMGRSIPTVRIPLVEMASAAITGLAQRVANPQEHLPGMGIPGVWLAENRLQPPSALI